MDTGEAVGLSFGLIIAVGVLAYLFYHYCCQQTVPEPAKREHGELPQDHLPKRRSLMRDTIRRANKMAAHFKQRSSADVLDNSARPSIAHVTVELEQPQPASEGVLQRAPSPQHSSTAEYRQTLRLDSHEMLNLDAIALGMDIPSLDRKAYNTAALAKANNVHQTSTPTAMQQAMAHDLPPPPPPVSDPTTTQMLTMSQDLPLPPPPVPMIVPAHHTHPDSGHFSAELPQAPVSKRTSTTSTLSAATIKSGKPPPPVAPKPVKPPKLSPRTVSKSRPLPKPAVQTTLPTLAPSALPQELQGMLYQDGSQPVLRSVMIDDDGNDSEAEHADVVEMYDGTGSDTAMDELMQDPLALGSPIHMDRPWSRSDVHSYGSDQHDNVSLASMASSVVFRLRRTEELAETEA
eukprot:m.43383 g.43383  ORF g.43383 m.43383 type:complete len:404 (-) comp12919_c0_seq1:96-1307(-)